MQKPLAKDLSSLLSDEAKSRKPSPLKGAFKYYNQPGMTFLGGGLPLSEYFPFDNVSAEIPTAPFTNGIGAQITEEDKTVLSVHKKKEKNEPDTNDVELSRALQYGYTEGAPELVDFLKEHTDMVHKVPYSDWGVITSIGNTQSWDACLRTFCARGESILVEQYSFSSALETAHAQGINTIPVEMDNFGLIPEVLEKMLDNWTGPKPKLLYTICTGQNPTGSCLDVERRRAVYKLAQKHNFIIIEDEPYYFLQMETYTKDQSARSGKEVHSHEEFLKAMIPSYLSMDIDGRVIRLDSFSKTVAPGLRLGWIVAQQQFLERFIRLHEVSIQTPSGLTQTLANAMLQRWGQKGYLDWLIGLRHEYTHKRDVAIDAVHKFFPPEVTECVPPVAGMFFTTSFDASKHPKFEEFGKDPLKVENALYEQGLKQGCLMIPGSWFAAKGETNPPQPEIKSETNPYQIFFRGTYAAVPLDDLTRGLEKFGQAVKLEFGL